MLGQRLQRWPNIETATLRQCSYAFETGRNGGMKCCRNTVPTLHPNLQTVFKNISVSLAEQITFIENETCVLTWNIGKGLDPN